MTLWTSAVKGPERSNCETQDLSHATGSHSAADEQGQAQAQSQAEKESWSSAFIGMVNSLRPSSTRSPSRRTSVVKHPTPPPPPTPSLPPPQQRQLLSTPSPQQPTKHAPASSAIEGGDRPNKRIKLTLKGPRSPAVHADIANTTDTSPRPPVKLTIAEPHGSILQTTNGVRRTLNVNEDILHSSASQASTPDPSTSTLPQRETRKSSDRRSLRSHDEGARLKSELAVYFPNYEEIIYDAPREPEFLNVETIIHISDEPYKPPQEPKAKNGSHSITNSRNHHNPISPTKLMLSPSKQKNKFNGAQVIDFSSIEKSVGHHPKDPLTDAFYFKSHRRAERKEKQLRNIEKERAMHEKAQLERLLEALQGHDWLRVMGINSVSDLDLKKYAPKRNYFIDEVNALLLKFKTWKDEERRIRLEKEAAALAEEEAEDEDEDDEDSDGSPSSSDVDASAARQLQIEATGGAKGGKGGKGGKAKGKQKGHVPTPTPTPAKAPPPPPPPPLVVFRAPTPEGPFVSFYSKPHLRAAAVGKSRHGRNFTAFGQPIPDMDEEEFSLPEEYVTPEALKANAREQRRRKRESAVDASNK